MAQISHCLLTSPYNNDRHFYTPRNYTFSPSSIANAIHTVDTGKQRLSRVWIDYQIVDTIVRQ